MSTNGPLEDLQVRKLTAEIRKINRESDKLMMVEPDVTCGALRGLWG